MKTNFTLLIADRNPNVRKFLQREMTAAGYRILLAENAHEVLKLAFQGKPLDMIRLDLDLPDADETHMLQHLLDRVPVLPIVVHTYPVENENGSKGMNGVVFVEKKGSSVERLKQVVYEALVGSPSRLQKI